MNPRFPRTIDEEIAELDRRETNARRFLRDRRRPYRRFANAVLDSIRREREKLNGDRRRVEYATTVGGIS